MDFILNSNTEIKYGTNSAPVSNAVGILLRDISKRFEPSSEKYGRIILEHADGFDAEQYVILAEDNLIIRAGDNLGFVYGLLYISEKFLSIKPFWFWMDQRIEKTAQITISGGEYKPKKASVKYRGWFINDEVLIMKWSVNGDKTEPWRMVFEALLRCGGNMVIPGTDKDSRLYRRLASDMGLWITHHHAEPMGAEMFVRAYPDIEPNYADRPELFIKLWEEAVKEQKDMNVIWTLGFRGQGDCPFWSSDTSGRFDTPQKRGALISDIIELQRRLVLKYVENPVFCTNLYGEITELYEEGHIHFADDIIKVCADNGYGKMVTRRRDNHTVRIPSLPRKREEHAGIYYHVSFYDLQAANHITMLPNSVDFVNRELDETVKRNATDFWIVNSSNIRPHVYYLDALRKKWYGEEISDETHSVSFAEEYFNGNAQIARLYRDYPNRMIAYGFEEDEHAGEQFYTENVRILIHAIFNNRTEGVSGLNWILGGGMTLDEQIEGFAEYSRKNFGNIEEFRISCANVSASLDEEEKALFNSTLFMQASIHYYCTMGVVLFADGYRAYAKEDYKRAFVLLGDSAVCFKTANASMRLSEYGVWKGFYANDCFADIKHTAYMVEKLMGLARERGDNARHDKWYRDTVYAKEDRNVMTLLVTDNHMTDRELYEAMKEEYAVSGKTTLL